MEIMTIEETIRSEGRGMILHGFVSTSVMPNIRIGADVKILCGNCSIGKTTISDVSRDVTDRNLAEIDGGWRKHILVKWRDSEQNLEIGDKVQQINWLPAWS